jgi:hypothetical protein
MFHPFKKLLRRGMLPTAVATLFALGLVAPVAQAHNSVSHKGHQCSCDTGARHAVKKGTKAGAHKAAHKKAKVHRKKSVIRAWHKKKRSKAYPVARRHGPVDHTRTSTSAPGSGYRRILPEPNCNMEPPFAVPACEARLTAAQHD